MPRAPRTYVCSNSKCKKTGKNAGRFKQVGQWMVGCPIDFDQSEDDPSAGLKLKPTDRLCEDCAKEIDPTGGCRKLVVGPGGDSCGLEGASSAIVCTGLPIRFGDGSPREALLLREVREGLRPSASHGEAARLRARSRAGSSFCEHGGGSDTSAECGALRSASTGGCPGSVQGVRGSQICEHGRRRSTCKECGGSQVCEHGRQRSMCKGCGGSRHLRAREAAILLQGVRGQGHLRAREAAKQLQGLPRRLTCCVFGNVFINTTGRYVSHPRSRVRGRVHRAASRRDGRQTPNPPPPSERPGSDPKSQRDDASPSARSRAGGGARRPVAFPSCSCTDQIPAVCFFLASVNRPSRISFTPCNVESKVMVLSKVPLKVPLKGVRSI